MFYEIRECECKRVRQSPVSEERNPVFDKTLKVLDFSEAMHHSFTDFPLLIPGMLCRWLGVESLCDPVQCAEAMIELTAHFLKSCYEDSNTALNLLTYEKIITKEVRYARKTAIISG